MDPLFGALAAVLVAAVSGLVTWLISRRAKSGKIDTSEAATLWDEGTRMRVELREEVASLKAQLSEAITAMSDLRREIRASRSETERAREETRLSRAETRRLMDQIEELHSDVKTSNTLSIGALADNTETRRILLVPEGERSIVENNHIATAGDRQPEADRPHVPSDDRKKNDE